MVKVEKLGTNVTLITHTLWKGTKRLPKEAHRSQDYLCDLRWRLKDAMKERVRKRLWKGARKVMGEVTRLNPSQAMEE